MKALSFDLDVASAIWKGMRPYQEDSLSSDFHAGSMGGFAIVADGMGGHAAGDVASNLASVHGSGHLKLTMQQLDGRADGLPEALNAAIDKANDAIAEHVRSDSRVAGMGSTFLAVAIADDALFWGSVGDSPLFLVRDGTMRQLNQDHSMAPVIAAMAERGEITAEQAKQHPDRNALTSVLMGERVEKRDVPSSGFQLMPGDVLIAASDGLQFLSDDEIARLVISTLPASSSTLCDTLMRALKELEDPYQDNCAIIVMQMRAEAAGRTEEMPTTMSLMADEAPGSPPEAASDRARTRVVHDTSESEPTDGEAGSPMMDSPMDQDEADTLSAGAGERQGVSAGFLVFVLAFAAIAAAAVYLLWPT